MKAVYRGAETEVGMDIESSEILEQGTTLG